MRRCHLPRNPKRETPAERDLREATEAKALAELTEDIAHAMFAGDTDKLQEIAGCQCCCYEHTFGRGCPAYAWGGCRGQGSAEEREQIEGYALWYAQIRGITREQFFAEGMPG